MVSLAACEALPWATVIFREQVDCGAYDGPDCDD